MEARAITRYLRISPRKVRLIINMIRSKPIHDAYAVLSNLNKKGASLVEKTLKSAEANAKSKKMDEARLYIRQVQADGGPVFKRYMARAMGRANTILKRTTHLSIVLGEREARGPLTQRRLEKGELKSLKSGKEKKKKQLVGAGT